MHYAIDWISMLRGRVGYSLDDGLLLYATGGVAFTNQKTSRDQYQSDSASTYNPYGDETEIASTEAVRFDRTGWTVGGGLEYAINSRWSVKADYSYTRFGTKSAQYRNATAGVTRDYTQTIATIVGYETIDFGNGNIIEVPIYDNTYVDHEGTSSTINGRETSNWINLHSVKFGLNYHF
jgi:hemoglobin/transferrin/lactoferrin receptor protein